VGRLRKSKHGLQTSKNRDYQAFPSFLAWFLHILLGSMRVLWCFELGAAEFIRQEGNELTGKLETPVRMSNPGGGTGIAAKWESDEEIAQREQARRMAREKARARTLARQQALAERLASTTEELLAGLEETSAAAREFSHLTDNLAINGQEVGKSCDHMRDAAVKVDGSAVELLSTLGLLSTSAGSGTEAAAESVKQMDNMMKRMEEAAEKNARAGQRIAELEDRSRQIGDIVQTVVMIADQTNLLALNAAIEAARAGEYGRGFAVVADEVRNLAEVSERSARDIRGVVDDIRSAIEKVVKDINAAVDQFRSLQETFRQPHEGFVKMGDNFNRYACLIEEDFQCAEGLRNKVDIWRSISEEMGEVAQQVVNATRESALAVGEQSKALTEVNSAAEELGRMAEEVRVSTDVDKSAVEVAAVAEQLSASIEQISASARQMTGVMARMGDQANSLNQAVGKTVGVFEESQGLVVEIVRLSETAGRIIEEVVRLLDNGRQVAREVWQGLRENIEGYEPLHTALEALQEQLRSIGKIVVTIENVSIQTNMLAVNGFVEAATAADHGRGFSVVAGDIRTLAAESAENAEKIKELVEDIQMQMARVVTEIAQAEEATLEADREAVVTAEKNQMVSDVIDGIEENRVVTVDKFNEIQALMVEGSQDVENIKETVEGAGVHFAQVNEVAVEQSRAINELANAMEEIASLADEIQTRN
jgi:methyl-accepting chemotaxis protein